MNLFRSTTTTPITTDSINRSPLRRGFLLIPLLFVCLALAPTARPLNPTGVNNTANGSQALLHNTTPNFNDAVGAHALFSNVDGFSNNALGESALFHNIHGAANTAIGDVALANNDSTGKGLGNSNTA